jgi:uncharacterized protein
MKPSISLVEPNEYFGKKAPGLYLEDEFNLPLRRSFRTGVPVFIGLTKSPSRAYRFVKEKERLATEKAKTADKAAVSAAKERLTAKKERLTAEKARAFAEKAHHAAEKSLYLPKDLSLWSQFSVHVGGIDQDCMLAYAVRGFFENGGARCYVIVLKDESVQSLLDALDCAGAFHTIDLVCLPDVLKSREETFERQQLVVRHCETMGDRFAILDSWPGDTRDGVSQQWSNIVGNDGALYYPWIVVRGFNGNPVRVPPCGHIAGVYSRTDASRGVHKAPANEVLAEVIELEHAVTNADQDFLNPKRVNCLRAFAGRGIRVWGARTLAGHDAWTYINVRRLFLTAVRWINWHMAGVVFEPNDARLWARIERELNTYFIDLYRRGALKGRSPQEAFYVKCDAETNPSEVRELGRVITEIGLAPANPFEFVVVRLIHGTSGVTISGPIRPEQNQ